MVVCFLAMIWLRVSGWFNFPIGTNFYQYKLCVCILHAILSVTDSHYVILCNVFTVNILFLLGHFLTIFKNEFIFSHIFGDNKRVQASNVKCEDQCIVTLKFKS